MSLGPKRPTFKPTPYGYTRRSRGIPRWLLLLITGIVLGAGGVLFLQSSYAPQRLTIEQSEQLRSDINMVNIENQRLQAETRKAVARQQELEAENLEHQAQVDKWRKNIDDMQANVDSLIQAIPADPRGTSPGIRSADMVLRQDGLHYRILLIQDKSDEQPDVPGLSGTVKLLSSGTSSSGATIHHELTDEPFDMGLYTVLAGVAEVPAGYRPRQVTIQITGQDSGKVIATRTIKVEVAR